MIGKGLFHTHLVVRDITKSVRFYSGLFGMEQIDFKDGTLVFLTTPGRNDLLALNPVVSGATPADVLESSRERKNWRVSKAGWRTSATCCRIWKNTSESLRP